MTGNPSIIRVREGLPTIHPEPSLLLPQADFQPGLPKVAELSAMIRFEPVCSKNGFGMLLGPSGSASHDVVPADLVDRCGSCLPHNRAQFAAQQFENRLDARLAKGG